MPRLSADRRLELLDGIEMYQRETGETHYHVSEVRQWLRERGLIQLDDEEIGKILDSQLSEAMRGHLTSDATGRTGRTYIARQVRIEHENGASEQKMLWSDFRDSSRIEIVQAYAEHVRLAANDLGRAEEDREFYNHNHPECMRRSITKMFDFMIHLPDD